MKIISFVNFFVKSKKAGLPNQLLLLKQKYYSSSAHKQIEFFIEDIFL